MSKLNICLYGLAKQLTDEIGEALAKKLDVYYANFEKIFEFEIIDLDRLEKVCGKEYFEKKESSVLKRICTYENTLINIDYSLLNSDKNNKIIKDNCLVIYLKLDFERFKNEITKDNLTDSNMAINIDLFKDRNKLCENNADIIIECQNLNNDDLIDLIIVELLKYYEKK